jgi:hypothetical protein
MRSKQPTKNEWNCTSLLPETAGTRSEGYLVGAWHRKGSEMSGGLRIMSRDDVTEASEKVRRVARAIARRGLGKTFGGREPSESEVEEEYRRMKGWYDLVAEAAISEIDDPTKNSRT